MIWLFIYVLAISLFDLRTHRIPNGYTLPLIVIGMIMHFPGSLDLWFTCFILLSAWKKQWMGAGDVKLWLAILWALPVELEAQALPFLFLSFFITSLAQIMWRLLARQSTTKQLTPAAWRTIPFIFLCWYVH